MANLIILTYKDITLSILDKNQQLFWSFQPFHSCNGTEDLVFLSTLRISHPRWLKVYSLQNKLSNCVSIFGFVILTFHLFFFFPFSCHERASIHHGRDECVSVLSEVSQGNSTGVFEGFIALQHILQTDEVSFEPGRQKAHMQTLGRARRADNWGRSERTGPAGCLRAQRSVLELVSARKCPEDARTGWSQLKHEPMKDSRRSAADKSHCLLFKLERSLKAEVQLLVFTRPPSDLQRLCGRQFYTLKVGFTNEKKKVFVRSMDRSKMNFFVLK